MTNSFDFGSGMPLPPMAGPTSIYNSFQTLYNPSSHFNAFFNSFGPQSAGNRREQGHQGYRKQVHEESIKQDRYDSAHPRHHYTHHNSAQSRPAGSMPQLAIRMDGELLDYLKGRRISPFFIHEIDQFLYTHPELATLCPKWVDSIRTLCPLEAYRFFLKGYTRPARYRDDVFPTDMSSVNFPSSIPTVANAHDVELIDFFDGYSYRYDLLELLDHHAADLVKKHEHGVRLTTPQFKLVCFVVWGQPVDAYKFFEYNYQSEWLPHRYLPEHVVLHELPKESDYSEPKPFVTVHPCESPRTMRTFLGTRLQMARACDAGVDVIEVLMQEFVADLARRGFRRVEIDNLRRRAEKQVDYQRKIQGSADIVDMVMGMAIKSQPSTSMRGIAPNGRRRIVNNHVVEAKRNLEFALSHKYDHNGDKVRLRRLAERELVLAIVAHATRDRSMTRQQAGELLAIVPLGRRSRTRREKRYGMPNILKMLASWL